MLPELLLERKDELCQKLKEIGDAYEDCLKVIEWTTSIRPLLFNRQQILSTALCNEIIIWGETDGYQGLDIVRKLFNPLAVADKTLIISGGQYGQEKVLDNIGSLDLFAKFVKTLRKDGWSEKKLQGRVIIESISKHTGHQAIILGGILLAAQPEKIWIVLPRYHITRFIMFLGLPLYKEGFQTYIIPYHFGSWQTRHKAKGPIDNPARTFTYEELLALPPQPSRFPGKFDCGEIDKIIHYAKEGKCLNFRQAREWLRI